MPNVTTLERERCDEERIWLIKSLMLEARYREAVNTGEEGCEFGQYCGNVEVYPVSTTAAEFRLNYGLALIYVGDTQDGVAVQKGIIASMEGSQRPEQAALRADRFTPEGTRFNRVVGRAHNNLGYALCVNLGDCRAGLGEYYAALPYFMASRLPEELANTCDNIGRAHAELGDLGRAQELVDAGLGLRRRQLRRQPGSEYRLALSLNSKAIVELKSGKPNCARRFAEEALGIFELQQAQRGIGLASITLGRTLRRLGELCLTGRESGLLMSQSAAYLARAGAVFEENVDEPVRLAETLNELGITYFRQAVQEDALLLQSRIRAVQAIQCLGQCAELAERHGFSAVFESACRNLAQADSYMRSRYGVAGHQVCAQIFAECTELVWEPTGILRSLAESLQALGAGLWGRLRRGRSLLVRTRDWCKRSAAHLESRSVCSTVPCVADRSS